MATTGKNGKDEKKSPACTICKQVIKPLNLDNVLFHYVPILGAANYMALSVNVMNPSLVSKIVPSRDITNLLLVHSIVGSALWIYSRPHVKTAPKQLRLTYSGFNSIMFNFGSTLSWALLRTTTKSNCIATIIGLASGCGIVYIGKRCLEYLDTQSSESNSNQ